MGDVVIDISSSLDGFIAQPDDASGPIHEWYFNGDVANEENSFFTTSRESAPVVQENLASAGAVIAGRRTYDFTNGWDGNHPMGDTACFVLTHEPPSDVPAGATPFTFVTDGIESAIEQAKVAAGEKVAYIMGGASVMGQALSAGLVDRFNLHLAHVFLGEGIRLFNGIEHGNARWPIRTNLTHTIEAPGVTHLYFDIA